jgi:hypothetical protein
MNNLTPLTVLIIVLLTLMNTNLVFEIKLLIFALVFFLAFEFEALRRYLHFIRGWTETSVAALDDEKIEEARRKMNQPTRADNTLFETIGAIIIFIICAGLLYFFH